MADGGEAGLRPLPFQVVDPERIPTQRYYDEDFFKLETERLWSTAWQMACRLEQIPNVGDWVEYTILGKSVLVVRTKTGVKAYHNTCRHRGVQLGVGHGNCETQGFICPFHGWRWNLEGDCTFVYGKHLFSQGLLDKADLALAACRVELWGGCAFINFDDDARPVRDCIGPLADRLDQYQVNKLRAEWWFATEIPSNWKVAMEAFMEGYHVLRTHPQLHEAFGAIYNAMYGSETGGLGQPVNLRASARENVQANIRHMEQLNEGMAGLCHAKDLAVAHALAGVELPDDPAQAMQAWWGMLNAEVTRGGRARGEATPDLNALSVTHPVNALEFIFPHYFLLPFLSGMSSYRIRPLGPETCLFELWSLTLYPEGQEPIPPMEPVVLPYDSDKFPPIPRQDYSNIPLQQRGLHAGGFEFMRLSKDVEGLISNYHRLIDAHLRGAASDKLAKGMAKLGGNFNGPILDLEL